jgi:hypothetical protein
MGLEHEDAKRREEREARRAGCVGNWAQCLLYLRNGNFRVCLLANFGEVPLSKSRWVHTPDRPALYGPHP